MNDDPRIAALDELASAHLDNVSGTDTLGPAILALFDRWYEQLIAERDESETQSHRLRAELESAHRIHTAHHTDLVTEVQRLRGFTTEVRSILALNHKTSAALHRNIQAELLELDRKSA